MSSHIEYRYGTGLPDVWSGWRVYDPNKTFRPNDPANFYEFRIVKGKKSKIRENSND